MSHNPIRDALDGVVRHFTDHPEDARSTDSTALAVWRGGLRCEAQGPGGAVVASDMPPTIGGGGTAPSPGWLLRAALANCDASMIAIRAAQLGIALTRLEVSVDSDSDDRGMFGVDDDTPAGPLRVRVKVTLAADGVPEASLRGLVDWAQRHSPVADALQRVVPMGVSVEIG